MSNTHNTHRNKHKERQKKQTDRQTNKPAAIQPHRACSRRVVPLSRVGPADYGYVYYRQKGQEWCCRREGVLNVLRVRGALTVQADLERVLDHFPLCRKAQNSKNTRRVPAPMGAESVREQMWHSMHVFDCVAVHPCVCARGYMRVQVRAGVKPRNKTW